MSVTIAKGRFFKLSFERESTIGNKTVTRAKA
jgi:hypothetical protein